MALRIRRRLARVSQTRWGHRLQSAAPLAILAACCAVVMLAMPSCNRDRDLGYGSSFDTEGIPTVRVLLATQDDGPVVLWTTGGYLLRADEQTVTRSAGALPATSISRDGDVWHIATMTARGANVWLEPSSGSAVRFGNHAYRGRFLLTPVGRTGIRVINLVDMESYLAGVLSCELPAKWHLETYRAQAIAARSFALYQCQTFGRSHDHDLGDDTNWQVYGGKTSETDNSWRAVQSTRGLVLAAGPKGGEKLFLVQYSACNGGWVNGAYVIRDAPRTGPLAGGQPDPHGKSCPRYRWEPVQVAKADVLASVAKSYPKARELGTLQTVRVASETDYGRPLWVDIVGTNGKSVRIRAEDLRLALVYNQRQVPQAARLYSMNCRIHDLGDRIEFYDGRGFGHGVGLSQWGAEEKAAEGWTAEQILDFYYPGAVLVRTYS